MYNLRELCLEITDICPLNCRHCSGSCSSNSKQMLPLNHVKQVIDDFCKLGGKILELSGGEPLVHPSILPIIEYAAQHNLEIILYTSGNIWNEDRKELFAIDENLAFKLQQAGLTKIVFGLHGSTKTEHEAITQRNRSFENTLTSISVLKKYSFWIGIHFVPMKPNYRNFWQVCELSNNLGIDQVAVLRFVPQGRGQDNKQELELSKQEFFSLNNDLNRASTVSPSIRIGKPIDFRFVQQPSSIKGNCDAGKSRCLISPDGTIKPCPAFKNSNNFVAGNIKEASMIKIWNESSLWNIFRNLDYTKISGQCKSCTQLHNCKGGCPAQRILKYGDVNTGPDPCCINLAISKEQSPLETRMKAQSQGQLLLAQT
jgi:radical SAM protein with 4Fe4S-binding SPASM domain